MKSLLFISAMALLVISCENKVASEAARGDSTTVSNDSAKIDYAYQPSNHVPDYWERGNQKNLEFVLKSLKAFENNNIDECLTAFADSARIAIDHYDAKISKDSLRNLFHRYRTDFPQIQVIMDDYEAVASKDKKEEWVSLWYKEINTDKTGKVDSIYKMTDLKIENGKIAYLNEKIKHYPPAKK
jgi:hypothetical protein